MSNVRGFSCPINLKNVRHDGSTWHSNGDLMLLVSSHSHSLIGSRKSEPRVPSFEGWVKILTLDGIPPLLQRVFKILLNGVIHVVANQRVVYFRPIKRLDE